MTATSIVSRTCTKVSAFTGDEASRWASVAGRAVYFGHQSVGSDIVAGLEELNDERRLGIRFVETRDPSAVAGPAFVHFRAGNNTNASSKNASLLRVLDARPEPDAGIVMLKYCYVDVRASTDLESMVSEYLRTVSIVRERHPDVTVVHTTVPLTTVESSTKARIKRLLGRSTVRDDAAARARFNTLLRNALAGGAWLFDLARLEATRPDGMRATFRTKDADVDVLAADYTSDGGHLNARGRRVAASGLLDVLASVIGAGE
jgi:hypothetical protein